MSFNAGDKLLDMAVAAILKNESSSSSNGVRTLQDEITLLKYERATVALENTMKIIGKMDDGDVAKRAKAAAARVYVDCLITVITQDVLYSGNIAREVGYIPPPYTAALDKYMERLVRLTAIAK